MIIKVKTKTDIIWPIVFLYILQTYFIKSEAFFVVLLGCIGVYLLFAKKIMVPKVPGLLLYIVDIGVITIIGLNNFVSSLVVKDIFYELCNISPIILGYYLYSAYGKTKSMWKTVCFMTLISSIVCFAQGIGSLAEADFNTLKVEFGIQITSLAIVLPIFVGKRFIFGEVTFSKKKDLIVMLVMTANLCLSVSRTAFVSMLIGLAVMIVLGNINQKVSIKSIGRTAVLLITVTVVGVIVWNVMPDSITSSLGDRFSKTFSEINTDTEFSDTADAQNSWRGYENQCARQQWADNTIGKAILGEGNGAMIKIKYVPTQFKEIVIHERGNVGISILHNTFYSLLIKGGALMLALFLYMFMANILKGIRNVASKEKEMVFAGSVLVTVCVCVLANVYVVNGMFGNSVILSAMLLMGWVNAQINNNMSQKEIRNENK